MRGRAALAAAMLWMAACASPKPAQRPPGGPGAPPRPLPIPLAASEYHEEPEVVGVVHLVRKGETVYRIARAYGVAPADLLEENGIADPRQVAVGTELFVPGASRVVDLEETTGTGSRRPSGEERGARAGRPGRQGQAGLAAPGGALRPLRRARRPAS